MTEIPKAGKNQGFQEHGRRGSFSSTSSEARLPNRNTRGNMEFGTPKHTLMPQIDTDLRDGRPPADRVLTAISDPVATTDGGKGAKVEYPQLGGEGRSVEATGIRDVGGSFNEETEVNELQVGTDQREVDPHTKPFKLFMAGHNYEDIPSLKPWRESIEEMLQANPTGNVAVVYECTDGTQETSEKITSAVLEGKKPSHAIQDAWGFIASGRFNYDKVMMLEKIAEMYPRRIHLVQEWGSEEFVDLWPDWHYSQSVRDIDGLTREREMSHLRATLRHNRGQQFTNIITHTLGVKDVIGGVGLLSFTDTQVSHALTRMGYSVDRFFPDKVMQTNSFGKQQGTFLFSPANTLDRMVMFEPTREVSMNDVALALRGEQRALEELKENEWTNVQDVIKRTNKWMREQRKA